MERKFKLVDLKKDINVANWVSLTSDFQNASPVGSPRVTISSRLTENTIVISPECDTNREFNATPKSIKILRSPIFFKDNINVIRTNRNSKQKSNKKKPVSVQASSVNLDSQNVTPKVIYSPGIVRDTKDWRLDSTRSSKQNLNSAGVTQRSGSGEFLDTSRTFFKPEIRQNVNVNNWVTVINNSTTGSEDDCRIPPTFSARTEEEDNFRTENMSETVLQPRKQSVMSNKVGESRKEIEKLKTELETLISTNLKNKIIIPQHSSDSNIENVPRNVPTTISLNDLTPAVKQNVIVSPPKTSKSPSSVRRRSSTLISDTNLTNDEPKSKARTYDPESTREFIRRQKLRRKEKLQQEEQKKKEWEEFKKQKLENLKQRTLQLVSENVKKSGSKKLCAKRSEENLASKSNAQTVNIKSSPIFHPTRKTRARSFDREANKNKADIQKHVEKTKENSWIRSRSVSRELKPCDKKSPVKPQKSVLEKKPNSKNTISNAQVELDQVVNEISNFLNYDNKDEAAFGGYQRSKSSESVENIPIKPNTSDINSENNVERNKKSNIPSEVVVEKQPSPQQTANVENKELPKSAIPSNISNLKEIIKDIPDEIIKSANQSEKLSQKDVNKINGITHNKDVSVVNEDALKEIELIKQKLETSITQSNLENKRNETPAWLLPPSTLPYPYNFISAVRKKLEIVTQSPKQSHTNIAIDIPLQSPNPKKLSRETSIQTLEDKKQSNVSIQCSLENSREIKDLSTPKIIPPKPEEFRTFMSHKCRKQLVYNEPPKLQSPTNINKEVKSQNEKKEHNTFKSKSRTLLASETSDSDTTKNIPEISEEEQFLNVPENLKYITFNRQNAEVTTNGKNFTFDQIKVDKNSLHHELKKLSIKSENSDRLKNITFDRRNNSSSDISNLIKPDFKIDTSKISKHSIELQSNRSKYPSDIDSILSQYSKMKSSSKSNIHNESHNSQYSEDFNSSPTHHLSLPQPKSSNDDSQHKNTETRTKNSKAESSDLTKIKSEILASLARQHSSLVSNNPKHISESVGSKISGIITNDSTDINLESLNKISNGSQSGTRKSTEDTRKSLELNSKSAESLRTNSSKINEIKNKSSVQELSSKNYSESNSKISENTSRARKSLELNSKNAESLRTNSLKVNEITNNSSIQELSSKNYSESNQKISENTSRARKSLELNSKNAESLRTNSSKVNEIKNKSSNQELSNKNYSEFSSKISELTSDNLESLDKYFSKLNSEAMSSKTDNKSNASEMKSKKSNESQIKTNPSNNISHSKKEESIASIPEDTVALKTDSQSVQESSIIKSSIDESLIQSINEKFENSESKSVLQSSNIKHLSKPTVNLKIEKEKYFRETKNNPNQIHLKFQAEVHLLNSFNNSLQQVVAVEKSLHNIHEAAPASTINLTRGCGAPEHMEALNALEPSVCSQDLAMSHMSDSGAGSERSLLSGTFTTVSKNPFVGVSLGMYDQMIRDEDNRLENLKAILKLRDKALFDQTKSQLAWLEIQKKQLRENGQLNDVTVIKKKQRGLIIKLEQERHEMQRLKQAHKQAAKERKNALREQKNIIKQQLSSTDQIPTKIRRLSQLERRQSGPVKVYRVESRTEHIKETTMSKNSSGTDETISVTTSSVVTQISEKVSVDHSSLALKPYPKSSAAAKDKIKSPDKHSEKVKRALLMKEADLEKRRKEAEELLKWHERLKQEEAQVVELERQAKSIQLDDQEKKRVLTGAQLNKIWKGITGSVEKEFDDHKKYQMSKRSLDKFYQNAWKIFKEISEERNSSKRASEESYTSDFDPSHSPSKINLSSSLRTQINDSESISPSKIVSEKLRKISESSRIDFITSAKSDTDVSEQSTVSEKTQLSTDKKSIVTDILSVDQQNETDSNIQTVNSVISELNIISDHESVTSKKSSASEVKSRKSITDSDFSELQMISDHELSKLSDKKDSINSVEEQVRNSSTDLDLPELQIVSELDLNTEEIKFSNISESIEKSKNSSTDSDLPGLEIDSELNLNTELTKSAIIEKSNNNSESQIKSEIIHISEQALTDDVPEPIQSIQDNNSSLISESEETKKSETQIVSVIESVNNDDEPNKIESSQIITEPDGIKSKLPSDQFKLENKTDISITLEENIHSENFTPKEDVNISLSFREIIPTDSEQQIVSEISPKTEENTSKIVDDNILLPSDSHVSEINANKKVSIEEETQSYSNTKSNLENSVSAESSDLRKSSIIESLTLLDDNISENGRTKSEILSAENESSETLQDFNTSSHSDIIKSTVLSDHNSPKLSIQLENGSNIKSDLLNKTSDTNITSEVENTTFDFEIKSSLQDKKSVSQSQDTNIIPESDKDLVDAESKSKFEELEVLKSSSHEELIDSTSKSQDIKSKSIKSIELAEVCSETFIDTKSNISETQDENVVEESESDKKQTIDSNIQSEVSTPHESELYYQTDFERISDSKESNEETDLSDSEAKENTETIKSSFSTETEKESVTKIETPKSEINNSETFESEKESGTIIESPKSIQISTKEDEIVEIKSAIDENSPSSESQLTTNLSQNGEESVEDNKDTSLELQNEDMNVVGVSHIDVRKRVSEILADTTVSRGDKSPRLQDLYVTAYDVMTNSPESTPETGSPTNEGNKRDKSGFTVETPYRTEAEELLRKQLEIEQEIKKLERQQQNLPYLFMREIPNKPPPPYKPPNAPLTTVINSVIPVHADQIRRFVCQSADVLFQAYVTGNLKEASFKCSEDDQAGSQKYVFDLCKEIALEVCKPKENTRVPSWKCQKNKFQTLISRRPVNKEGLCSVMNRKVLHLLNFEPVVRKDNLIIRWSRKKRDHVDEILVLESQTEETEWTNYDSDEQTIKDNLTNDIMDMLILETAQVMCEILKKKKKLLWTNYC